jgi:hypothetical protein
MEEVDLKRGFNMFLFPVLTCDYQPAHGRFGEQEECESLFIAPCYYFFWGFKRLSALHTIFLSTFLPTLFLISLYWNSKYNIIHNDFIFLCKNVA